MVIHKANHSIFVVIVTTFNNGWTWSIKPGYKPEHVPVSDYYWYVTELVYTTTLKEMKRKRGTMFLGKRVSWNWMQINWMYEVKLKQELINWHLFIGITLSEYVHV